MVSAWASALFGTSVIMVMSCWLSAYLYCIYKWSRCPCSVKRIFGIPMWCMQTFFSIWYHDRFGLCCISSFHAAFLTFFLNPFIASPLFFHRVGLFISLFAWKGLCWCDNHSFCVPLVTSYAHVSFFMVWLPITAVEASLITFFLKWPIPLGFVVSWFPCLVFFFNYFLFCRRLYALMNKFDFSFMQTQVNI